MACGIYKITNILNHKVYIGQSIDIKRRWSEEKRNKDGTLIEQAIQQEGEENFLFEIIEECPPSQLNEREIYWSEIYNSTDLTKGYNTVPCGESFIYLESHKAVCQFDKQGNFLKSFNNASAACKELELQSPNFIRQACIGKKKTAYGYMWRYAEDWDGKNIPPFVSAIGTLETKQKIAQKLGKPVLCIDKKTNQVICEYPSAIEAERQLHVAFPNGAHVSHVCTGKRLTAYGYKWRYKNEGE